MQNKKTLIFIVAVLIIGGALYISKKGSTTTVSNNTLGETSQTTTSGNTPTSGGTPSTQPKTTSSKYASGKCNLTITYPTNGASVSFPLTVKGIISNPDIFKGSCLWNNIASSGGTAQLFYNFNNYGWKSQGIAVPIITTGTQVASTTAATVTLNFFNQGVGLPKGSAMKIVFTEFNPKEEANPDTFDFLVYLK